MKRMYLTPELLLEDLYAEDIMAASNDSSSGSSSEESSSQQEIDNAFRAFSVIRGN